MRRASRPPLQVPTSAASSCAGCPLRCRDHNDLVLRQALAEIGRQLGADESMGRRIASRIAGELRRDDE